MTGTDAPRTVVVTGAGGFIGRLLVPALDSRGYAVRAISRDATEERLRTPSEPTTEAWAPIVAGATAVVHLAAIAHRPAPGPAGRRQLRAVNVLMTEALARAAAAGGVSTFVFVSSIKAVAGGSRPDPVAETERPAPADCYGLAKLAAERRLDRVATDTPMRIVILRPPLVFGPGVKANFARLVRLARWSARGLPLPLARVGNRRSLLYAGNLVSAIARVLDCDGRGPGEPPAGEPPSGEPAPSRPAAVDPASGPSRRRGRPPEVARRYHLADEPALSTPELVARIARACGGRARLFSVPAGWIATAARAAGREGIAERLTGSLVVDSGRFRRDFAWMPEATLDQGLRATVDADRTGRPLDGGGRS